MLCCTKNLFTTNFLERKVGANKQLLDEVFRDVQNNRGGGKCPIVVLLYLHVFAQQIRTRA